MYGEPVYEGPPRPVGPRRHVYETWWGGNPLLPVLAVLLAVALVVVLVLALGGFGGGSSPTRAPSRGHGATPSSVNSPSAGSRAPATSK